MPTVGGRLLGQALGAQRPGPQRGLGDLEFEKVGGDAVGGQKIRHDLGSHSSSGLWAGRSTETLRACPASTQRRT